MWVTMEVIEAGLPGLLGCFSAFRNKNPEPRQTDKPLPLHREQAAGASSLCIPRAAAELRAEPGTSNTSRPRTRTALAPGLCCSQLGTLPSACPRPAEGQRSTRGSQLRPLWCRARENVTDQPALLNGAGLGASARAWGGAGICTEQLEEAQGSDPSKSPLFHEIQAPAVPGLHLVPSLGIRGWLREMWPQAVPTALLGSGQSFQLFPHEGPGNPWMEVWLKLPWHRWRGSCVQRANPSCCCA